MTLKLTENAPKIWGENLPFWYLALARFGSLFLMLSGLFYWVDILGVFGDSGLERGTWQVAAIRVVLACAFLIAAVGVWQLTFWGVVMWVLSMLTQTAAIMWLDDFATQQTVITIAHMLALVTLVGSSSWIYVQSTRQPE